MQTYRLLLPADSEYSTLSLKDGRQAIDIRSAVMPRTIILQSSEYGIEEESPYESDAPRNVSRRTLRSETPVEKVYQDSRVDQSGVRSSLRPSGSQSPRRSYQKNVSFNQQLEESTPQESSMSLSPRRLMSSSKKQMTPDDIRSIASGETMPPNGLSRKNKTRPVINSASGLPTFPDPNSPRDVEADRASGEDQFVPCSLNFEDDMSSSRRSDIKGRPLSSTRGVSESTNSMYASELTQSSRTRPRSTSRGDEGGILPATSMRSNQSESLGSVGSPSSPRDSMKSDKSLSNRSAGSSSNSSAKSLSTRMSSRK